MPGIFGILYQNKVKLPEILAERMCNKLGHGEDWFSGRFLMHTFGFHGVVDFKPRLEESFAFSSYTKSLVLYGKIYSLEDSKIFNGNKAKILLSLYEKYGLNFLRRLNGSFVLSIYDEEKGKFMIATDKYGSKNVFYSSNSDKFLFASEIKGILSANSVELKLNLRAISEFFTFSHILGDKTFFEEIKLVSPASVLIYDLLTNRFYIKAYWDFEFKQKNKSTKNLHFYLKKFDHLMEIAVERRMRDKNKIGVFLSGGLDSRLIAVFSKRVADKTGKELISYTFGVKGCLQQKIAMAVANELKIENRFFEIPSDSIAKYAEEVVYKGDGHIRIRDAHFISKLNKVQTEVDAVLVGFSCGTVFGAHLSKRILHVSSRNELLNYLFTRSRIKQVSEYAPQIFAEAFKENLNDVMKEFVKTVREIALNRYEDIAHYWDFRQRARRYLLPIASHIEWYVDVRDPFLDNEVVNFAINLPLELRLEKRFIHKALKYCAPALAKIPQENTGVPPDKYGLPLLFSKIMMVSVFLLKDLIQRLSFGKILFKPKDYRGYDYWIRTGSKKYVEDVLLHRTYSKVFDKQNIRKILEEHMMCQRNHDQLICDILNVQLLLSNLLKVKNKFKVRSLE